MTMKESFNHEQMDFRRDRLLVCGIGSAGSNMTRHLQMKVKREKTDYLVLDTDRKCLDAVQKERKMLIGESICHGTGTDRCVQKGRDAAIESKRDIEEALAGYRAAVILFGAGGGTGTGAAPEIIRTAKEMGIETVVFATKPFAFEARTRNEAAQECFDSMRNEKIRLTMLENERFLQRTDKNIRMDAFLESIDDVIVDFVEKIPVCPGEGCTMQTELLKTYDESAPKEVTIEQIMDVVCDSLHVTKDQVLSKTRKKDAVKARLLIMYLCKYVGGYSFRATGSMLGGGSERTVRRGVRVMAREYNRDEMMRNMIDLINNEMKEKANNCIPEGRQRFQSKSGA